MTRRVWAVAIGCLLVAGCASQGTATGAGASGSIGSAPALSSPAPAFSSPVDVGSETPPPLPTPTFGSEGTLPPMPPGGRTLDTSDPDSVWAAQNVIDVFAEEVSAVSQFDRAYCNVAIDPAHDGLTVWWHGTPSAPVLDVVNRARLDGITAVVLPAAFGQHALDVAMGQLDGGMQKLGITMMNVATDCSGVDVGLATVTPQGEAAIRALVDPSIPLLFKQMDPAVAL